MINDNLKLRGDVAIVLKDKNGNVKESREINNLVVTAGLTFICSRRAVTEAGVFNASSSGTMLCRTVFPVVNKGADDTMSVTWTITLTAS